MPHGIRVNPDDAGNALARAAVRVVTPSLVKMFLS